MTQASILLKIAVLTIVFAEKLDGFILNNLLPETTTEEGPISPTTTFSREAVTSQYVFDEIHTNLSEVSEKFLNKTTAHPKTDAKSNQAHLLTNESNSVDLKSPLKTLEYANDKENEIVAKNLDNPIEKNIGNDVHKGSLPVEAEQIYQNKTEITENRDITQPEVPQILNEDELSETTTQTATDDRNTSLETTTATLIDNKGNNLDENSLYLTTMPSVEIEPVPNKESTSFVETMTSEQTTLKPSHQENLQDLNRFFETEPSRTRQMRDFNFGANANEKSVDSNVSSEIDLISGKTNNSSSDSLDSSSSSSSLQDENNAGEETSNTDEVSAEKLFETKINHASEETVTMEDSISKDSTSLRPITAKPIEIGTEVIPQEQIKSETENVVPIEEIQAVTESVGYGDVVNDTIKPGVEEKPSVSNATIIEHIPHNEILVEELGHTIDSVENGLKDRRTNTIQSVTGATQVISTETPPLEPSKPTENASHTIFPNKDHSSANFHATESDVLPEIDISTQTSVEVTHKSEINYNDNEIDDDNDSVGIKAESALQENIQIVTEHHQNYSSNSQGTNASDLNSKPHSPELHEISSVQTTSSRALPYLENELETSTETTIVKSNKISPTEELQNDQKSQESFTNEISEEADVPIQNRKEQVENSVLETSSGNDVPTNPTHDINTYSGAEPTTEYARHIDTLQTMRDESSVISDEVISPTPVARSLNAIVAEGLGKPLPTRSVGDEPSSSSYLSEDKTTTVLVLCSAAGGIFFAFSVAIYLISFQRQHGTLDIEMQEQECGKDDLDNDEDSETRVSLLNKQPTADSDDHSSD